MTIRRWTFPDLNAIASLEADCFRDAWTYRQLADSYLSSDFVGYLAEEEGVVLGCAAYIRAVDEADLVSVVVRTDRRREGIAEAMLETLCSEALFTGIRRIFLEVRSSNRAAIALYLKNGFTHVALRKKYYGDEDAVIMKKEFCESD